MAKQLGILVGLMNCNKNNCIWTIYDSNAGTNDSSAISFNKGNMLKPWFVSSIDNPVTKKNYYSGEKQYAGKPVTADTAKK